MRKEIEQRLREVYPTGDIDDRDDDALYGRDYADKFIAPLTRACEVANIQFKALSFWDSAASYKLTLTEGFHPSPSEWLSTPDDGKLRWLNENRRSFPVLWLRASRVYPAYLFYYNLWNMQPDRDVILPTISHSPPSDQWAHFHEKLHAEMEKDGFLYLLDDEGCEEVEFVTEDVYEDEDGNDLPEEAPPRKVVQNVYSCLFQIT